MKKDNYGLAQIGIAATEKEPQGAAPSDEELALFIEGKLSFERRQEVISHLNVNPLLYQQWMQLVELVSLASQTEQNSVDQKMADTSERNWFERLKDWLGWKEYALAGSMAAVVMTVLIWPASNNEGLSPRMDVAPPSASQGKLLDKDRAFAAGLKSVDNSVTQALTLSSARSFQDVVLRKPIYDLYFQLGELTAKGASQCRSNISEQQKLQLKQSYVKFDLQLRDAQEEAFIEMKEGEDVCLVAERLLIPFL